MSPRRWVSPRSCSRTRCPTRWRSSLSRPGAFLPWWPCSRAWGGGARARDLAWRPPRAGASYLEIERSAVAHRGGARRRRVRQLHALLWISDAPVAGRRHRVPAQQGNGPRGDVAEPALVRAAGLRRRALGRRAPGAGRAWRGVRGRGAACRVRVVLMAAGRRGAPEPLRAAARRHHRRQRRRRSRHVRRRPRRAPPSASPGYDGAVSVRKAVFPAAGLGTRFLPATKAQPKEMLPLVDKPMIQYVVEEAVASGLSDIIIGTGRGKRAIEDHFDAAFELEYYLNDRGKVEELAQIKTISEMASVCYVRQKEPLGLGHAILCARPLVGDEPFAVFLGDDIVASPRSEEHTSELQSQSKSRMPSSA